MPRFWTGLSIVACVLSVSPPTDAQNSKAIRQLLIFGKLATPLLIGHDLRLTITNVGDTDVTFEVHTFDFTGFETAFSAGSNCGILVNEVGATRGSLSKHASCEAVDLTTEERPDGFHAEILILDGDQSALRAVFVADQLRVVEAR
jgi:hypothetical protein